MVNECCCVPQRPRPLPWLPGPHPAGLTPSPCAIPALDTTTTTTTATPSVRCARRCSSASIRPPPTHPPTRRRALCARCWGAPGRCPASRARSSGPGATRTARPSTRPSRRVGVQWVQYSNGRCCSAPPQQRGMAAGAGSGGLEMGGGMGGWVWLLDQGSRHDVVHRQAGVQGVCPPPPTQGPVLHCTPSCALGACGAHRTYVRVSTPRIAVPCFIGLFLPAHPLSLPLPAHVAAAAAASGFCR